MSKCPSEQPKLWPEYSEDCPATKTMNVLEGVVPRGSKSRICSDEHCPKNASNDEAAHDYERISYAKHNELPGQNAGKQSEPQYRAYCCSTMKPSILIDFGERTSEAERRPKRDEPAKFEDEVDDVVLAHENCEKHICRSSG